MLLRWKWLITALTVVAAVAAGLVSLYLVPPKYEARATFTVEVPNPPSGETAQQVLMQTGGLTPSVATVLSRLTSADLLTRTATEARLNYLDNVKFLREAVRLEGGENGEPYAVVVTASDPETAVRIADSLVRELANDVSQMGDLSLERAVKPLDEERGRAEKSLVTAQEELRRFVAQQHGSGAGS